MLLNWDIGEVYKHVIQFTQTGRVLNSAKPTETKSIPMGKETTTCTCTSRAHKNKKKEEERVTWTGQNFWTVLKIEHPVKSRLKIRKSKCKIYSWHAQNSLLDAWTFNVYVIITLWFCTWPDVLFIVSFKNSALYTNVYGSYMLFLSLY